MKTIVVAVDGSPTANLAVDYALEFARAEGARILFVHVDPAVDAVARPGTGLRGFNPLRPIARTSSPCGWPAAAMRRAVSA